MRGVGKKVSSFINPLRKIRAYEAKVKSQNLQATPTFYIRQSCKRFSFDILILIFKYFFYSFTNLLTAASHPLPQITFTT